MLSQLDAYLVGQANRLASVLQEEHGQTMPGLLSHAAMATLVTTASAIVAMVLLRSPFIAVLMLICGSMTIRSLLPLLARYQRDAERGWSQSLARDYAVRAIGAQEGQRTMRHCGLGILFLVTGLLSVQSRALDIVDLLTMLLVVSSVVHLYLACAEPKPPGTRRQESHRLAMQNSF